MKLKAHNVQRQGDKIVVTAAFNNRFRKPVHVTIPPARPSALSAPLWEGDAADVMGLFGGLAEIAWSMGWRPRGFDGRLMQTLATYKIPPEEGA